jgi:hypothetical protein
MPEAEAGLWPGPGSGFLLSEVRLRKPELRSCLPSPTIGRLESAKLFCCFTTIIDAAETEKVHP